MNQPLQLLLVDDHALVRGMLAAHLEREPDLTVVGSARNAEEAVKLAEETRPDVILMDIDMPGLSCFDATKQILSRAPGTRIIFLSAFSHDSYISDALQVKAHGYVTKREPPEAVVAAILEVAHFLGEVGSSAEVRDRIMVDGEGARLAREGRSRLSTLTPRELEVLRHIAQGMTKKLVAQSLHISVKTVENHCNSLMAKLNIHDRVELTRFAIREGLAQV